MSLYPCPLQDQVPMIVRPKTAKPKNPDEIEFQDATVAKDYRLMYDKIAEMEKLLAEERAKNKSSSSSENSDEEDPEAKRKRIMSKFLTHEEKLAAIQQGKKKRNSLYP